MEQYFGLECAPPRNHFSLRNYPTFLGFNEAEDKYAFGGPHYAQFESV